jgi:hypothetical protein
MSNRLTAALENGPSQSVRDAHAPHLRSLSPALFRCEQARAYAKSRSDAQDQQLRDWESQ